MLVLFQNVIAHNVPLCGIVALIVFCIIIISERKRPVTEAQTERCGGKFAVRYCAVCVIRRVKQVRAVIHSLVHLVGEYGYKVACGVGI